MGAARPSQAADGPEEVPAGMEAEAALMEELAAVPLLTKALARPAAGGVDITVLASQHNLPANAKRQLQYSVFVPQPQRPEQAVVAGLPTELQPSVLTSVSPSGTKAFVAKAHSDGVLLELWAHKRLVKELLVPKSLHGPVINDGWFARGAAWSPDESVVAYVAETPAAHQTPLFGKRGASSSSSSNGNGGGSTSSSSNVSSSSGGAAAAADTGGNGSSGPAGAAPRTWRGVSAALEDWGELNTGKRPPSLFALHTPSWTVHAVPGAAGRDVSWGQPAWAPDGQGLVAVAWPHRALNFPGTARRLGIVHCYNRPAELRYLPYQPPPSGEAQGCQQQGEQQQQEQQEQQEQPGPEPVRLARGVASGLSPVFTPDGSQLLFISQEAAVASGVHAATSALYALPWDGQACTEQQPRCVVPVLPGAAAPGGFPGLYAFALHEQGFVGAETLLVTTQWCSQTTIIAVDLPSGRVAPVTPTGDPARGSWTLQGVCNSLAVATLSAPNHPPQLMLAAVPPGFSAAAAGACWDWQPVAALGPDLSSLPLAAAALAALRCSVLDVTPTVGDTSLPMQAVVQVSSAAARPAPAIVVPHGGPHTALAANFYAPFVLLAAAGYAVVAVNYRGSLGFGEAGVQSLPGEIGRFDVADCVAALDAAVAAGIADPQRAAVCGGSHGGFLSGHLMGQHPDRFKCAALRNPVLNIALMVGVTDIPDWCFIETYGTQEGRGRVSAEPSPEVLAHFWAASPIAHIAKVSGPMLFLLGAKDRRVPLDDGWRYVDALNSRGIASRVLVFPEDTHALDKPQTEFEQWLNIAWWMQQWLPAPEP